MLDARQHLRDVLIIEGLDAGDLLDSALRMVFAAPRSSAVFLVASTFVADRPTLPTQDERAAWHAAQSRCIAVGIRLLDWLIISGIRWRSLAESDP